MTTINRREFIQVLGTAGLAQWFPLPVMAQLVTASLNQLASARGLLFGSCLALKYFVQSPAYQQLFLAQCSVATPEIHMKWSSLSNQPGVYDFTVADKFVTFCATNHLQVRGHTLIWHDALPVWAAAQLDAGNGGGMMADHIARVAGHFAGKLYSWDVV